VPLLAEALIAIGCELEEIIERHSHVIALGRVVHLGISEGSTALAYWRGGYIAIERTKLRRFPELPCVPQAASPASI
jgi:flavin reductase (DIM6/NTAB) family NADH-FMN oxidoreductase RutF